VYIGSFWDRPLEYDLNRQLFETEEQDLLNDLTTLPRDGRLRLLNDLIKRTQLAKVHALVIAELRRHMPLVLNKKQKQKELIHGLSAIYSDIRHKYGIPLSDFPAIETMKQKLKDFDFSRFHSHNKSLFRQIDEMMARDVPKLMSSIVSEQMSAPVDAYDIKGGKFDVLNREPFGYLKGEGWDAGADGTAQWIVEKSRHTYDKVFATLSPVNGKISSVRVKAEMIKSKLPNSTLNKIYRLSDVDRDGLLDADEYALAMHLMAIKLDGHDLPLALPPHLVPPSKRTTKL
ncbi:unnamed protein product, partial [Medioppia subpectinata]